jgi:uncharacterized protein with PhoU and TrkA domain
MSRYARTIVERYALEHDLYRLRVRERSPFVGTAPASFDLTDYPGLTLVAVQSGRANGPGAAESAVAADDVIVVRGDTESVSRLVVDKVLAVGTQPMAGGSVLEGARVPRELVDAALAALPAED